MMMSSSPNGCENKSQALTVNYVIPCQDVVVSLMQPYANNVTVTESAYAITLTALNVVTNSPVPFIIVQENKIDESGYNDIVVPLDLAKETKQKLTLVANMAQTRFP